MTGNAGLGALAAALLNLVGASALAQAPQLVTFGAGVHEIGEAIVLGDRATLTGQGMSATTLRAGSGLAALVTNADPAEGNRDITISNLTIDCEGRADFGIQLIRTSHLVLRDVRVTNCRRDGIRISGQGRPTRRFSLIGVEATDNGQDGIIVLWAMRDGRYDNIYAEGNGRHGVTFDHSEFTANNIIARANDGSGIFLRNLFATTLSSLTATHNGQHGILVQGWVSSLGTGWRAQANSQGEDGVFDEVHFSADDSLSYGATRDSVLTGLVTEGFPDLGAQGTARFGVYVEDGVRNLRLVGGNGNEGALKLLCHRCCEADLSANLESLAPEGI